MTTPKKTWLGLTLTFFMICLLLYASSGHIATWVIEKNISQLGFYEVSVSVQRPSLHSWRIHALQVKSDSLEIKIQDVVLHYAWFKLFSGQFGRITIANMLVFVQKKTKKMNTSLPVFVWPVLPVSQLDIQQLSVHFPSEPATVAKGSLHFDHHQLQLELIAHQADKKSGLLRVILDQTGQLYALIEKQTQGNSQNVFETNMQWYWQQNEWRVQGQAQVDMGLMLESVQTWLPLPIALKGATGELHAQWQLAGSLAEPWQKIKASLNTSGLLQLPTSSLGLNSQVSCQDNVCDWSFSQQNELSTSWSSTKEVIDLKLTFPKPLQGQFTWQDEHKTFELQSGEMELAAIQAANLETQPVRIQPSFKLTQQPQQTWRLQEARANLQLESVQWQAYHLYPQIFVLDVYTNADQWRVQLHNDALHVGYANGDVHSQFKLNMQAGLAAWQAQLAMSGSVEAEAYQAKLNMWMHCKALRCDWNIENDANIQLSFNDTKLNMALPKGLVGHMQYPVFHIDAAYPVSVSDFRVDQINVAASSLLAEKEIQFDMTKKELTTPLQLLWSHADVRWQDKHYASQATRLKIIQQAKQFEVNLDSPSVTLESKYLKPLTMHLAVQGTLDAQQVKAKLELQLESKKLRLYAELQHHLLAKKGQLNVQLDPVYFDDKAKLSDWLVLPFPLDITSGTCAADSVLNWQQDTGFQYQGRAKMTQLSGVAMGHAFSGLDSKVQFSGDMQVLRSSVPMQLRIAKIDVGFPMQDIMLKASFKVPFSSQPSVKFSSLQANLLGGQLLAEHIELDLNRASNPFKLEVQQLDLAEILKLRQQKDVFATGMMSGQLPLNWTEQGLKLTKGRLQSDGAGGRIRYMPSESVNNMAKNSHLKILLGAFSDFHYQKLKADLDYQADGLLQANIQLSGNNKNFQEGQTLNLNLNYKENILQLIRSLQMANDIGNTLGEHVQELLEK